MLPITLQLDTDSLLQRGIGTIGSTWPKARATLYKAVATWVGNNRKNSTTTLKRCHFSRF